MTEHTSSPAETDKALSGTAVPAPDNDLSGADASPKIPDDAASFPESTVLKFRRGTRLQYDRVREQWFIQAPERAFFADPVAAEILQLVNGKRSLTALIDTLAAKFSAPRETIAQDVLRMTRDLADKQVLQAV